LVAPFFIRQNIRFKKLLNIVTSAKLGRAKNHVIMSNNHQSHFWFRINVVLFVLLMVLLLVPIETIVGQDGDKIDAVRWIVWLVLFVVGIFTSRFHAAEKKRNIALATPPAEDVLEQYRPFMVYLRSFNDEQQIQKRYRHAWPTEEEQVAAAFESYGTLIAISDPASKLPVPGAAYLNASNDTWEDKVKELVAKAIFVVVRIGESPGVLWELNLVIRQLPPSRVLLISALTADAHTKASSTLEEEFDIRLPRHRKGISVITFDSYWNPTARYLRGWNLRGDWRTPNLQIGLQVALVPLLNQLGFNAEFPPVRASKIVSMLFFLLIGLLVCAGLLHLPIVTLFYPNDGSTMSTGFKGLLIGATIGGIGAAVFIVYFAVRAIKEFWFPEHLGTIK
jgi:hypothetical protein